MMPDTPLAVCYAENKLLLMYRILCGVIVILLTLNTNCLRNNCSYSHEKTELIIKRIQTNDSLTEEDYSLILNQLDFMMEYVYSKAQLIVDSGYKHPQIRARLKLDTTYIEIIQHADILDSTLLEHINTPITNRDLLKKYNLIKTRNLGRFKRIGLL